MAPFFTLATLFIILDRATKLLAVHYLRDLGHSVLLVGNWLKFTYAENLGIAFGVRMLPPAGLLVLTLAISAGVVAYVWKSQNRSMLFLATFALILGGGVGNLIDRIMLGHVIDFIHFDLYQGVLFGRETTLWPIFNVADSCITIGACMLLFFHERIFPTRP